MSANDGDYDPDRLRQLVEAGRPRYETAQELVLGTLRDAILDGVLAPGARLRQEDLATVFDTSRIPIREALRVLEYEGLAISEPHRGFTVTALDADQIEEIYDLRIVLESHAVRLAIPLLTDGDLDDLQRLYDDMEATEASDEKLAKREQFYLRLYGVTARPRLVGLIARLPIDHTVAGGAPGGADEVADRAADRRRGERAAAARRQRRNHHMGYQHRRLGQRN